MKHLTEDHIELGDMNWRALRFFNLYRILLCLLFISLIWIGQLPSPLGIYNEALFSATIHGYLVLAGVFAWTIHIKIPRFSTQVNIHVLADIIAIGLLMYASNGLSSGFGMLLVIAIAGGSILKSGRIAILYAAIASLLILVQELNVQFFREGQEPNYIHAGFLGVTFFITAILGRLLASRVEKSEALAIQHAIDLESLAQLNEFIVQRMRAGIMVLDNQLIIRLINESGCLLLGMTEEVKNKRLEQVAPDIAVKLNDWLQGGGDRIAILTSPAGDIDIQLSFTQLVPGTKFGILVFIEDLGLMRQRAQHMKLASLGRLAASIAHEVRNPLGAIMHAGQLLSESGEVTPENSRLVQIITDQSRRVNTIIKNVQDISRRRVANLQVVKVSDWLDNFVNEFIISHNLSAGDITCSIESEELQIKVDPDQLFQVVSNLVENAIRHGEGDPLAEIRCGIKKDSDRVYIDIIDHGPGIPDDNRQHLFEPFFTTNSGGTGLGLYIARELCEANQASLTLQGNTENGCCFRIQFAHIEKQHNLVN